MRDLMVGFSIVAIMALSIGGCGSSGSSGDKNSTIVELGEQADGKKDTIDITYYIDHFGNSNKLIATLKDEYEYEIKDGSMLFEIDGNALKFKTLPTSQTQYSVDISVKKDGVDYGIYPFKIFVKNKPIQTIDLSFKGDEDTPIFSFEDIENFENLTFTLIRDKELFKIVDDALFFNTSPKSGEALIKVQEIGKVDTLLKIDVNVTQVDNSTSDSNQSDSNVTFILFPKNRDRDNERWTWSEANSYCSDLNGSYRLPTIEELSNNLSIVLEKASDIDSDGNSSTGIDFTSVVWSSTPSGEGRHKGVNFSVEPASIGDFNDSQEYYFTCIKN
jgi:hypothetical protein